jgi:hypothetical protein
MQKCRRCGGVLLPAVLEEVGVPLTALHCLVCGEWVDPLILHHRNLAVLPEPSRARTTIFNAAAREDSWDSGERRGLKSTS